MRLIDTHCHIHDFEFMQKYDCSVEELLRDARKVGVEKLVCVGTDVRSSIDAVSFVDAHEGCFASVAIHPHEAENRTIAQLTDEISSLEKLAGENVGKRLVAIGECGLDYYYHDSVEVKERQQELLRLHLGIATKHTLPVIFHIRSSKQQTNEIGDAFADFFTIFDEYENLRGVVHSFSATNRELKGVLDRGLYVGLNGIMTFTDVEGQLEAAKAVPIDRLVFETDAPFLTPTPFRGKMCRPEHIALTAQFLSELRGENLEEIVEKTSKNAEMLFGI